MQPHTLPPLTDAARGKYRQWWDALPAIWHRAFNQAYWGKGEVLLAPTDEELHSLWHAEVLRLAGPRALYPNLSFELDELEALRPLHHLKFLVVIHHRIRSLAPLAGLTGLTGLFVLDNALESLVGVESLKALTVLQFQYNAVASLEPLRHLTQLEEVYATHNALRSLEGITEAHSDRLRAFRVLPNAQLPQREVIKVENLMGVRCLQG